MPYNLILLGPPGSGKGTQAELLREKFQLEHIDIGLCLRQVADKDSKLGKCVNRHINTQKDLVPIEVVMQVMQTAIQDVDPSKGIVLDGAPRKMDQIQSVEDAFARSGRKIDAVIFLHVPDKMIIDRVEHRYRCPSCHAYYILGRTIDDGKRCPVCGDTVIQRQDDTPEGVLRRLEVYRKNTMPVIEYYRKMNMLIEVGGGLEAMSVFKSIVQSLEPEIT